MAETYELVSPPKGFEDFESPLNGYINPSEEFSEEEYDYDDYFADDYFEYPLDYRVGDNGKFEDKDTFAKVLNQTFKKVLEEEGLDTRYSEILTSVAAFESNWGKSVSGTFNYGGIKDSKNGTSKMTSEVINGKKVRVRQKFRNFSSVEDYCRYKIQLLDNRRYNAFNTYGASTPFKFWEHVLNKGYATGNKTQYMNNIHKIYSLVKKKINAVGNV